MSENVTLPAATLYSCPDDVNPQAEAVLVPCTRRMSPAAILDAAEVNRRVKDKVGFDFGNADEEAETSFVCKRCQ